MQPEFLVCDEAVAALDVSIQAQVLNLFMDLRRELDLTYLFISHDLGVVRAHLPTGWSIMYLGRIVEEAPTEEVFARPNHPYTQALLAEVPRIEARKRRFTAIKGEIPSPAATRPPAATSIRAAPSPCRAAAGERPALGDRARPSQRLPPERQGLTAMRHAIAALLLLGLAACAERADGVSGPYVGGAAGGNVHEDTRIR